MTGVALVSKSAINAEVSGEAVLTCALGEMSTWGTYRLSYEALFRTFRTHNAGLFH